MTLVEFLTARLDEDEAVARRTLKNEQRVDHTDRWFASHNNAITSMAPHRAVAEVEAKRRIVVLHEPPVNRGLGVCRACNFQPPPGPCRTIRVLALPYAAHPDYRAEWAV